MHVDSTTNAASLLRLTNDHQELLTLLGVTGHEKMTVLKALSWIDAFGIAIRVEINKDPSGPATTTVQQMVTLSQQAFFKWADLIALLNMRLFYYRGNYDLEDDRVDELDIKEFRHNVALSQYSTTETARLLMDLQYDSETCVINQYSNHMEYYGDSFKNIILVFGNWIEDWDIINERHEFLRSQYANLPRA